MQKAPKEGAQRSRPQRAQRILNAVDEAERQERRAQARETQARGRHAHHVCGGCSAGEAVAGQSGLFHLLHRATTPPPPLNCASCERDVGSLEPRWRRAGARPACLPWCPSPPLPPLCWTPVPSGASTKRGRGAAHGRERVTDVDECSRPAALWDGGPRSPRARPLQPGRARARPRPGAAVRPKPDAAANARAVQPTCECTQAQVAAARREWPGAAHAGVALALRAREPLRGTRRQNTPAHTAHHGTCSC